MTKLLRYLNWLFVGGIFPFVGFVKLNVLYDPLTDEISFPMSEEEHDKCQHYINLLSFEWFWRGWGLGKSRVYRLDNDEEEIPS